MNLQLRSTAVIRVLLATVVLAFTCGTMVAQLDTGSITGTVMDPTGAAIPNAKITLTNVATNATAQTQSTSTGTYAFNNLPPGSYTVQSASRGFQDYIVRGLDVHVQQVLTVDVHMSAGDVKQQVTVTAAAPLLQSENAAVGQTITGEEINDLPLASRDWGSLSQLAAGVSTAPPGQPTPDSGSTESAYFSVDGVNVWQNDFRLNGINDNIEFYGGNYTGTNAAIVPPPDAIQEFKVQNGDFNAEFGHSTGGVVNAALKSGTNHIHGDVWEYVRNDALNANYFFNAGKRRPEYRQNLFGGTIGGPIFKNKTFFFADYQGGRFVTPSPATSTVPTLGMVNSGFTNLQDNITYNSGTATDALGRIIPHGAILDPATTRQIPASGVDPITGLPGTPGAYVRDPFYNCTASGCPAGNYAPGGALAGITDFSTAARKALLNVLPTSRLDPNAIKLLGVYPAPSVPGKLSNNFSWIPGQLRITNTYDVRIDEDFNSKNVLFGVFDRSYLTANVPSSLPGLALAETGGRLDSLPAYAWAVGYTHTFTPTLINDMHVGMVHSDKIQQSIYGNTFGIPAQYGIQGVPQVANNGGLPPITINGLTHIGVGNFTPTLQYVWSIEGVDEVTKVYHNHAFKAGVQVDDLYGNISQPPQGRGDFNFNGQYSDIPNSNSNLNGMGDLLLTPTASLVGTANGGVNNVGGMSSFSGSNISGTDDHRWYWGAFFQDDWKVTPMFTLNLGLRWDYYTPYVEVNGRQANFVATGGNGTPGTYYIPKKGCSVARSAAFDALLASNSITLACVDNMALGNAQKTNFAPRLGFAYRVTPKLVVRGGYGIAYGALGNLGYGGTLGTNYPFVYTATFPSPDSQHPLLLSNGQPATMEQAFNTVSFADPTIYNGQGLNLYGRQYDFQTPYVQTQNLTIQEQFTAHDSIQVGYVGTEGRHLDNLGYNNSPTQILPTSANPQNYIPYKSFARNSTYETTNATSSYNSLQTTYEHQTSYGLYMLGNYTYSKCMSDQHTQAQQNQQYRAEWLPGFGISHEYALCDTDATHLVHLTGIYKLPFGTGRMFMANASKAMQLLFGGWNVNAIYSHQSGQPFTITCPKATSEFGCFAFVVPGQNMYAGPHNYTQWLNPAAFAQPDPLKTTLGEADFYPLGGSQQQARGPSFSNLDSAILKDFNMTESVRLQFRAEAFNTTNTPPFSQPGSLNFTTTPFSTITSTKNSNNNFGARTLQLALKLFY